MTGVTALRQARDSLEALLAAETTAWAANGPKPSYSIDGESVDWNGWLDRMTAKITELTQMIAQRQPYIVRTRQTF